MPSTATSYNNVAGNLNAQGKYSEAEPLFRKAFEIRLEVLGAAHSCTVQAFENLEKLLKNRP